MKIQLKRSNVLANSQAKEPTPSGMEFGELAVNYNETDPSIFIKGHNGTIIRIAGYNAVGNKTSDIEGYPDLGDGGGTTLDSRYLSATQNDTAQGEITFANGAIVGNNANIVLRNDGSADYKGLVKSASTKVSDPGTTLVTKDYLGTGGSNGSGAFGYWNRTGTILRPVNTGDSLDIGSGNIKLNSNGSASFNSNVGIAGSVGIGITSTTPSVKLHVKQDPNNEVLRLESNQHTFRFKNVKTGASTDWPAYQQVLEHGVDTTVQEFIKFGSGNDDNTARINLGMPATPDLVHLVSGKVGIGNGSPQETLDVNGNITSSGKVTSASTTNTDSGTTLVTKDYLESGGSGVLDDRYLSATQNDTAQGEITFANGAVVGSNTNIVLRIDGSADYKGSVKSASTIGTDPGTTLVTKDYVESGGNNGTGAFGYWDRTGTNLRPVNTGDSVDIGSGNITLNSNGNIICSGKITSASTVDTDSDTTLVTKDYVKTGGSNGTGAFGYWERTGTDLFPVNAGDAVKIGGTSLAPNITLNADGSATFAGQVDALNINSTSDIALKKDITPIEGAVSRLCNIKGVGFAWEKTGDRTYGVIAQDVEKEFPELVQTKDFKSVNYNGLIGVLIEAIKELKAEIEELKKE